MSGAHLHLVVFLVVAGSGTATEPVPILPHRMGEWTASTSDLPGSYRNVTHSPAVSFVLSESHPDPISVRNSPYFVRMTDTFRN